MFGYGYWMTGQDVSIDGDGGIEVGYGLVFLLAGCAVVVTGLVVAGHIEMSREVLRVPVYVWPLLGGLAFGRWVSGIVFGTSLKAWVYLPGMLGFMFLLGYTSLIKEAGVHGTWWDSMDKLGEQLTHGTVGIVIMLLFFFALFGSTLREMIRSIFLGIKRVGLVVTIGWTLWNARTEIDSE